MAEQGAIIIDPANIPTSELMTTSEAELCVLLYELKADLNAYLSTLIEAPVRTLEEIIAFNKAHAAEELPFFDQDLFERAQATTGLDNPEYLATLAENQRLARQEGIDAIMEHYQLDALIVPTSSPAWCIDHINGDHDTTVSTQPAALAGYPAISVPAGTTFELPVGITFIGQAYSEPTLIKLAYAFEQATKHRTPPRFLPTTN
jgi:amidase